MAATLREMTDELQRVLQLVADAEGELDDKLEALLDEIEGTWQERLTACAYARERLRMEEIECEYWARAARERLAAVRARRERLEQYMADNMVRACVKRVEVRTDKVDVATARKVLQQWHDGELSTVEAIQAMDAAVGLPAELPPIVLELYESRRMQVAPDALGKLPDRYLRHKVEADLVALRKVLDAGVPLPDGVEVTSEWKLKDRRA